MKRDAAGTITKYKARLVAKGFSQRPGIDYKETFSPVIRYDSIRYLLALATKNGYSIEQMDAVTAFLQGKLDEEVYMNQPEGFDDNSGRVCKLIKAIYGLKQASRQWNQKLDTALKSFGFKQSVADPCVYFDNDINIIIAVYVDDFLIFYRNQEQLTAVKKMLHVSFKMKDLGAAQSCLGLRLTQSEGRIELDQSFYIKEILTRFDMHECKPVNTPSNTGIKLSAQMVTNENDLTGKVPYQEAVGSLIHLTNCTRADIAFAVNEVSKFNQKHSQEHWTAVKRIFRYLRGTIDMKVLYTRKESNEMHAFCNSDFATDEDERRSCSAYVILMSNGPISWYSHRQPIIALSSTEAEYIALSDCTKHLLWLRKLTNELEKECSTTVINVDNESTIKLSKSDQYSSRTKHIDVRYHHVRELITSGTVKVQYVNTKLNVADSLTKAVTAEKTAYCREKMGICDDKQKEKHANAAK